MKRQLMGYGTTSDVYHWSNHTILKLFKPSIEDQFIEYEGLIHEIVYAKGVRIPKLLEEVEFKGRRGYIYEEIPGKSQLFNLYKKKWKLVYYAKALAKTQLEIHQHTSLLLPDLRELLRKDIHKVNTLTIEDAERLMAYIDILPEGNTICHMNFHPGKLFYNNGIGKTIDWVTAARSTPAADVARTYLLLKHSMPLYEGLRWVNYLERLRRFILVKCYITYYCKHAHMTFKDIEIWLKPIAIARLSENISDEEKKILFDMYM